jgi:hypothetical protein
VSEQLIRVWLAGAEAADAAEVLGVDIEEYDRAVSSFLANESETTSGDRVGLQLAEITASRQALRRLISSPSTAPADVVRAVLALFRAHDQEAKVIGSLHHDPQARVAKDSVASRPFGSILATIGSDI